MCVYTGSLMRTFFTHRPLYDDSRHSSSVYFTEVKIYDVAEDYHHEYEYGSTAEKRYRTSSASPSSTVDEVELVIEDEHGRVYDLSVASYGVHSVQSQDSYMEHVIEILED